MDENYNGGALLPKAESSDTPPTITVKKDGTKKRVYIYDYDKTGSISNRLTRLAQANVRSQSNSNFKYEISFSTTAQTIYFYNSGANVGDTCDFEIAIKRYQESVAQLVKFRVVVED